MRFRFLYVAISQLCGLISFTVVAKFILGPNEIGVLASYQGLQAVTAFLMMSIQYSNSRSRIFGAKFAFFFFLTYGGAAFLFLKGGDGLLWSAYAAITFACACYSNLLLTALEKFDFLLFLQIACSIILPFSMVLPATVAVLFSFLLLGLLFLFRDLLVNLSDMQIFKDGRNWLSSLSMQAPLVLLPVFDPLLVKVIGPDIYRNYVIWMKYCAGPINLVFSAAQFRILEKNLFNIRKLALWCAFFFVGTLLLVLFQSSLLCQVISLVIFTNFVSLLIRTNNLSNSGALSFFVGPVALGGYYYFLAFSKESSWDIKNYFILSILLCIFFNAFFSMLGVVSRAGFLGVKK